MLAIIAPASAIYAGLWLAAVLCAHFGHWQVAVAMVSLAAADWVVTMAAFVVWVRRAARRETALIYGGITAVVAVYSAALWFVALYATLQAQDPASFVSTLPVGFGRVWFAGIDNTIGSGIGATLPASATAGWFMSFQQILFWPSLVATGVAMLLLNRRK